MAKRVTVRIEHSRNLFFEKLLKIQIQDQEERKLKYVLHKAHENLKKCPLEIQNIVDLKNVHGIGENIAVKLEETWKTACQENDGQELTLKIVKTFTNDDFRRFQNGRKSATERQKEAKRMKPSKVAEKENGEDDDEFVSDSEKEKEAVGIQKLTKTQSFQIQISKPPSLVRSQSSVTSMTSSASTSSSTTSEFRILTCKPFEQPTVYLIADNREHRNNPRSKSVVEHLVNKEGIRVDIRSLSVGDYIWICRKIDGSEIVMDWVVERKTWEDLQSSIRGGRYDEQKGRLSLAPMKNRVYLIEASGKGDVALEQAVASTLSNGGYLIQRCSDTRDTSSFLKEVTVRLQNKASCEEISGVPFSQLQNLLQKKKAESVKEAWIRQLMVCPGMSQMRAEAVAEKFPSMPSLLVYFREHGDDAPIRMLQLMPQLTRPITRNLFKFFVR